MGWIDKLARAMVKAVEDRPAPVRKAPAAPRAPKTYQVGIVGESHYRRAIKRCGEGDLVTFVHEADNPHDARAIAVLSELGEKIGYLPRDSWLHRALLDEGKAVDAIIGFMGEVGGGNTGVSLDLRLGLGKTLVQMRDEARI